MFRKPWRESAPKTEAVSDLVKEEVERAVRALPVPSDGIDGKDADPVLIDLAVNRAVRKIPPAIDGKDGDRGPRGPRGPEGPTGPAPEHEWKETKLRFEKPDGSWGEFVELKGEKGDNGLMMVRGGGAPSVASTGGSGNGYFPGGWT